MLFPALPDLCTGDALVVAVVPFGDLWRNCDAGVGAGGLGSKMVAMFRWILPGERFMATDVEKFESALGTGAGGDVSSHRNGE